MKNIEKYPNTKDAIEAYKKKLNSRELFDKWLESEYEEPREPTLLEAAEELKNTLKQKDITLPDVAVAFSHLTAAIEREKRKPVRNFDKYKTTKDAMNAFNLMCENMACERCPYNQGSSFRCKFEWLYDKAGKEEIKWIAIKF